MPSGGHNRKPRELKIIQGTFRKGRNPEQPEPQKLFEVPKPPSYLGRYAKSMWRKLAPELVDKGLLTVLDLPALELTCDAYDLYRQAYEAIYRPVDPETGRKRPRTLEEYMEGRNSHTAPELSALRTSFAQFKAMLSEFGLGPAARGRINVPLPADPKERDPMERLLEDL